METLFTDEASLALQAKEVTKTFGEKTAVNSLTLEIKQGEIVALLGHNGAGKTTLLDMCLGLQTPNAGHTRLFGLKPGEALSRSLAGAMQQAGGLLVDYKVETFLKCVASTYTNPLGMEELLEVTDLTQLRQKKIVKLSGGEQQRVRFATALVGNPQLLILDEPTSGMDAVARKTFWELMQRFADQGKTIIFATHYLAEAEAFAERTVIMKDGQILIDDLTANIRRNFQEQILHIRFTDESANAVAKTLVEKFAGHITSYQVKPQSLELSGKDFDAVARYLLDQPQAYGLELTNTSLEEIYTRLVGHAKEGSEN
ncbi:ABC transporter ATP-binding protein [Gleimia coleocanis]|nr:ABC transporter ATP-binding protein [Gleimia coleocanis]